MRFVKMHGLGNDFIIINSLTEKLPEDLAAFSQKVATDISASARTA